MRRTIYDAQHEALRSAFRAFLQAEARPKVGTWEQAGAVDRVFVRRR